ncbi:adenine nucleotide translocase lysine N-methyltransferase-like isoform X1 [Ascaphus truei]|uniref:adenine nucleotide translocase lysine N-methyltransferase-like isoform X1 n=1 Tax=Ascaphus truei TaxID=8439 RepID=UPI003F59A8A7
MEDNIDMILYNKTTKLILSDETNSRLPWLASGLLASVYGMWAMFVLPGFRKVPWKLKVPFVPSSKSQTANVMKLLKGRNGRLVDLGSGDGRLVFAAVSMGLQSRGYELNPILVTYAKTQAWWRGISQNQATFVRQDIWTTDLSSYNNVTVFLSPSVMETLEEKLSAELPDDARIIVCRFPFPHWSPTCTEGFGLDQVWAYDMLFLNKRRHTILKSTAQC